MNYLPNSVIRELKQKGVTVMDMGLPMYQIYNCEASEVYMTFLEDKIVDVLLVPFIPTSVPEIYRIISRRAKTRTGNMYRFDGEIYSVQKEISNCPGLPDIPFGTLVCELVIVYANCHVLHKIKKSVTRPKLLRTPRITSLVELESQF